jgi:hypothetical protein
MWIWARSGTLRFSQMLTQDQALLDICHQDTIFSRCHTDNRSWITLRLLNFTGPEIKTPATRKLERKYATQSRDMTKKRGLRKKSSFQTVTSDSDLTNQLINGEGNIPWCAASDVLVCLPSPGLISRLGASGPDPFLNYPFPTTSLDRQRISSSESASSTPL